jgi:hypothetical protein
MTSTNTDWHRDLIYKTSERLTEASEHPYVPHVRRLGWPERLVWAAVLLVAGAVWGLAGLGLGRLTGWW